MQSSSVALIMPVVRHIVRRYRLTPDEAEDFGGEVMLRLLENDSAILRKHDCKSSLKAYLAVVINRMLLDYRRKHWGRWRPSAEALRLGPVTLRLEELVYRDGHSFSDACRLLRERFDYEEDDDQLGELWARLPARSSRRTEDLSDFVEPPSEEGDPLSLGLQKEKTDALWDLYRLVEKVRKELSDEDALIVSLRFERGFSVPRIAKALNIPQRTLYRRVPRILEQIREALIEAGISAETVGKLLSDDYDSPDHQAKIQRKDVSDRDG